MHVLFKRINKGNDTDVTENRFDLHGRMTVRT